MTKPRPDLDPTAELLAALAARYGTPSPDLETPWNDTLSLLLNHRSVRAFTSDPLPAGTLEALVAAAQSASSSSNLQTWSVVAVQDRDVRARLSEITRGQKHVVEAPLFLVWLADLARLEQLGRAKDHPTEGLTFLETLFVGIIDAALAAQNAVVALESLGLGAVYIGAIRNHPVEVARLLALPANVLAVFGLCVGRPDPARPTDVKPRLPLHAVLHRERYDSQRLNEHVTAYDKVLAAFQRGQNVADTGWSKAALERVEGAGSLSGRDRIKDALAELGFGLR